MPEEIDLGSSINGFIETGSMAENAANMLCAADQITRLELAEKLKSQLDGTEPSVRANWLLSQLSKEAINRTTTVIYLTSHQSEVLPGGHSSAPQNRGQYVA